MKEKREGLELFDKHWRVSKYAAPLDKVYQEYSAFCRINKVLRRYNSFPGFKGAVSDRILPLCDLVQGYAPTVEEFENIYGREASAEDIASGDIIQSRLPKRTDIAAVLPGEMERYYVEPTVTVLLTPEEAVTVFLEEMCQPTVRPTTVKRLYGVYAKLCYRRATGRLGVNDFSLALRQRGFDLVITSGNRPGHNLSITKETL